MNTTNDNNQAISSEEHLHLQVKYTLARALKRAINEDDGDAVLDILGILDRSDLLNLLNAEVEGHTCLILENLPEYLELIIFSQKVNALKAILTYKPSNPKHALDLDRIIIDEDYDEHHITLLNYTSEYIIDEDTRLLIAQLLLEAGANPNISDCYGYTPLHNAAMNSAPDLIRLLLTYRANPNMFTDSEHSCFESLLRHHVENNWLETPLPGEEVENSILACIPAFLEYHAKAYDGFIESAEELGFTRVLELLDETKTYPTHVAASYMSKTAMIQHLKDSSFESFELLDTHGNTPSYIAKKYNKQDLIDVLEKYEAVYKRVHLLKTNYQYSGSGLPKAIAEQRYPIASYLTQQEFGIFTATTNMHIHADDRDVESKKRKYSSDDGDTEEGGFIANKRAKY